MTNRQRVGRFLGAAMLSLGMLGLVWVLGLILTACSEDNVSGPTRVPTPPPAAPVAQPTPTTTEDPLPPITEDPALYRGGFKGCTLYIDVAPNAKERDFPITVWRIIGPSWDNQEKTDFLATVHATKPYSEHDLCYLKEQFGCWIEVHVGNLLVAHHFNKGQACTPQCVERWVELEPEVTYGAWGECQPVVTASSLAPACAKSRTKTTIIREQSSCTEEVREKSRTEETVTEPCECACEPTWIEQEPVVTEGEWGECLAADEGCAQSREVRTVISEVNSCTQETRVKSDETKTETQACECPPSELCYYRVSCGQLPPGEKCTDQAQQSICEDHDGIWLNFDGSTLDNHCQFDPPGISNDAFQLTPGQSGDTCLNKNSK